MKTIIAIFLTLLTISTCLAADIGRMEKDGGGNVVMGAAPRGDLVEALTGVSHTTNGTGVYWAAYCAADAKARLMPTSAKGTYKQFTIPATTWTGFVINSKTPFVNISGCTGELIRQ